MFMHEGPPPPYHADYTAMPTPGFPVFMGNQPYQPSNPLPPIGTQPQPQPVAGPVPGRRRLPPRPDCPLIVSSQPQFDTEHHRQLYYEPYHADDNFANMQSSWVGLPGTCFVQPDYNQPYPPTHILVVASLAWKAPETERGRQLVRPRHPNTDGGSDMAPVSAPAKTQSEPISTQALDCSQERISTANVSRSTETQNKPTEPENEPNPSQTESSCAPTPDQKKEELMDDTKPPLRIDTKNEESAGSSSEAGPKTPDTDESQEGAKLQTPAQADLLKSADTKISDTTETLKPVDKSTPNKGKSPEMATTTPTKSGNRRLEPAVPDNKHLLARHAFQHRKPLKKKYQPKTDTGKTIEQYTREINAQRASLYPDSRVPEHLLQEVIQELENERRDAIRKSRGLDPSDESSVDSGTSSKKQV
ncbi:Nucleotide-binding alpha-beta plait [Penicillium concentricum]|uniref:Nucleotide-binding alpha-beta plait n=1 Tax=Penicillium concentricum TaxID=293559 RepID=A0A9W9V820_9EURO|nr:Nucleotide-binding alpha-beta plait [Penicillium concentricum]KAJ5372237.1 Nucleotide-binding alpha-beta plait [Penicillium concentricum]